MRILVSGAAGFLGSHLCERFIKDGHIVYGLDNFSGGDWSNVPKDIDDFFDRDCCELTELRDLPPVDLVYHCAAFPHEGLSVFSPCEITRSIYMGTVALATMAINTGVKRFINCSSMARYGRNRLPFYEDQIPHPVDPYGIAKVAAENALNCLGEIHSMEVVHLVPHNIYGPRQRYCDPFRNVVAIMANLMLKDRQPIIYGNGKQTRCFSYIADCVEPMVLAGTKEGLNGEVINIGPDEGEITINELAERLATIIGFKPLEPRYFPDRPCEVKHAWPSSDKARRLLNYETRTTLDDGLKNLVTWIKEAGPRLFVYHLPIEIKTYETPQTWKERLF